MFCSGSFPQTLATPAGASSRWKASGARCAGVCKQIRVCKDCCIAECTTGTPTSKITPWCLHHAASQVFKSAEIFATMAPGPQGLQQRVSVPWLGERIRWKAPQSTSRGFLCFSLCCRLGLSCRGSASLASTENPDPKSFPSEWKAALRPLDQIEPPRRRVGKLGTYCTDCTGTEE